MSDTAIILVIFLAAHLITTVAVGKWLAGIARDEIRLGLAQLVKMFPPHVRQMFGITEDSNDKETTSV